MDVDQLQHLSDFDCFCKFADLLPAPVFVVDEQLQSRYQNSGFRSTFKPSQRLELEHWLPPAEFQLLSRYVQTQFCSPEKVGELTPIRCQFNSPGKRYLVELQGRIIRGDGELLLAFFIKLVSTTKLSNRRTRKRRQQLLNLLENPGTLIYIKDLQGRYRYVNPLFEQVFHVQNRQIRGKTDDDIFNGRIAGQFRQVDQKVCQSGEAVRLQEVANHDDGLHTYVSVKFPLRDRRGNVKGLVGISTDITEQLWAEQQVRAAQAVQTLLYPTSAPQYPGFDIAGLVSPAEVASGDYYDYIWLSPTRVVVAVGDVSGHGLGSALEMVETRSYLRAILRTEIRLDVTMECLNEFLFRDLRDGTFVSLFLAEIDLQNRTFRYVGAGHQADFLHADGTHQPLVSTGLLLGVDAPVNYHCSPCYPFHPGDILLITTDGITEAMSPENELFGTKRMLDLVRERADFPAQEIVEQLIQTSRHIPLYEGQADDMTAVLVKCLG